MKDKINVVRGGSWDNYYVDYFRCADRFDDYPDFRFCYLGFRIICSVSNEVK